MDDTNESLHRDKRRNECIEAITEIGRAMNDMDQQQRSGIEPDIEPLCQATAKLDRALEQNRLERLANMSLDESRKFILFSEKRRMIIGIVLSWMDEFINQSADGEDGPCKSFLNEARHVGNICRFANRSETEDQLQKVIGLMAAFQDKHPDLNLKRIESAD